MEGGFRWEGEAPQALLEMLLWWKICSPTLFFLRQLCFAGFWGLNQLMVNWWFWDSRASP